MCYKRSHHWARWSSSWIKLFRAWRNNPWGFGNVWDWPRLAQECPDSASWYTCAVWRPSSSSRDARPLLFFRGSTSQWLSYAACCLAPSSSQRYFPPLSQKKRDYFQVLLSSFFWMCQRYWRIDYCLFFIMRLLYSFSWTGRRCFMRTRIGYYPIIETSWWLSNRPTRPHSWVFTGLIRWGRHQSWSNLRLSSPAGQYWSVIGRYCCALARIQ